LTADCAENADMDLILGQNRVGLDSRSQNLQTCVTTAMKKIAGFLLLACACSHAAVDWHWTFDQTLYAVAPTDTITVSATLFNNSSSDGNVVFGVGVGGTFAGDMQHYYNFHWGPAGQGLSQQFYNLNLAPGESFLFVLGILTPINGSVPLGTYGPDYADLSINSSSRRPDNQFQVVVVPEPSVVALMCIAGIAFMGTRFRRIAKP